jgi:septal ring factor EnvC (AmiA/AmiB activator)
LAAVSRLVAAIVLVAVLGFAVAACGKSDTEQARDDACGAVDDIGTQVNQIDQYTLLTVTKDKLEANINSMKSDLTTIKDALPKLEASLKSQLESATNTFAGQVDKLAGTVGESVSLQDAANQITADRQQLKSSDDEAFASVTCN